MTRQQWVVVVVGLLLVWGALLVLGNFWVAIAWAAVLAWVSWPIYRWLCALLGGRETLAALGITLLLTLLVIVPVVLVVSGLFGEAVRVSRLVGEQRLLDPGALGGVLVQLQQWANDLPLVGGLLERRLEQLSVSQVRDWLVGAVKQLLALVFGLGSAAGLALGSTLLTILFLFFMYTGGPGLVRLTRRILGALGGETLTALLVPLGLTVRSVFLGLVVTAAVQGGLAGLGLWVAGIAFPLLFGVLVALLALLQAPVLLVLLPCVLYLAAIGQGWQSVALLAWSVLVVGSIDNVIKPLFISKGSGLPFVLVFLGVLGGLFAFGTIGIILGPAIFALLLVLVRQLPDPGQASAVPSGPAVSAVSEDLARQ
ncbi:AI-2E family transporter [Gloeobacter morelensis]|uniref:AI-2E family transporter n=1 Tax=Gloeobacter morelensis MG652769 TaxID=2781736 RepID=A0ABY3PS11_9CYAN|nr:AI-2E family transporter [Gloeobacter morelensis]UFP96521.1 AI-2E family transporter [Gloeobacter morelensis MG652769]